MPHDRQVAAVKVASIRKALAEWIAVIDQSATGCVGEDFIVGVGDPCGRVAVVKIKPTAGTDYKGM